MDIGAEIETFSAKVKRYDEKVIRKSFLRGVAPYSRRFMFENEVKALNLVSGLKGFQQIIRAEFPHIDTEYCGIPIDKHPLIDLNRYASQLSDILVNLKKLSIIHRDIIPRNLLIMNEHITLIDFTWAFFEGSVFKKVSDAPKSLGGRWKRKSGFDDGYSMEIIKNDLNRKTANV